MSGASTCHAALDPMPHNTTQGPGKDPFEPRLVYDEFIGRWIITASCYSDCLRVSASSDPPGKWRGGYPS